jgi:predicted ribosomally synthesized peptide with SipW-like signal peptide
VKQLTPPVIWMLSGVGLMVLAPLIVGIAPTGTLSFWSDADQAALQKASGDFHAVNNALADSSQGSLVRKSGEPFDPIAAKARHAVAKAELDKQQRRLRSAQSRPTWLLWTLRLMGIAAAGFGVWGYFHADPTASTAPVKRTATLPPKLEALRRQMKH